MHSPARLVSELTWKHAGRPALVIGGGPSAPEAFERIKNDRPWLLIAANAHAFRLGVRPDYVFCKDDESTETKEPMEPVVRRPGIPVIGRHFWTDYRVAEWPITGNSGQMSIAVAALMGCAPIVPIGFDGYQPGGTYWYDLKVKNVSAGRLPGHWMSRYKTLAAKLEGAVIRSMGDMTSGAWPRYEPGEITPHPGLPQILRKYREMLPCRALTMRGGKVVALHIPLPRGEEVIVSKVELAVLHRMGMLDRRTPA